MFKVKTYYSVLRGVGALFLRHYFLEGRSFIMEKWRCTICGYIYEPELGDPDGGIAPGTPFDQIPDSWVCPVCGAAKDMFEKI